MVTMIMAVTMVMMAFRRSVTMAMCLRGCWSRRCGWAGTLTPSPAWPAGETEYTCTVHKTGYYCCSLAGASVGEDNIPRELVTCCEDHKAVREMGERIHDIVTENQEMGAEPPSKKQKIRNDDDKD